jgi:hypothetical protein
MPDYLTLFLIIHIVSSTFWAGSTFISAWTGGVSSVRLFWSQMGSAVVTFLAGGALWSNLHAGVFGKTETLLGAGVAAAIIAVVGQIALRQRPLVANRAAAVLLAFAAISMIAARNLA